MERVDLAKLATNSRLRTIYRLCKNLSIPPTDPFIQSLTDYDLELYYYLDSFEDPEVLRKYKQRVTDESFEDYWNEEAPEVDIENVDSSKLEDWEVIAEWVKK